MSHAVTRRRTPPRPRPRAHTARRDGTGCRVRRGERRGVGHPREALREHRGRIRPRRSPTDSVAAHTDDADGQRSRPAIRGRRPARSCRRQCDGRTPAADEADAVTQTRSPRRSIAPRRAPATAPRRPLPAPRRARRARRVARRRRRHPAAAPARARAERAGRRAAPPARPPGSATANSATTDPRSSPSPRRFMRPSARGGRDR